MKFQWLLLLTAVFCLPAMGDTITYQGKLESGDESFDGSVEMIFELHESETGDSEIATHGPVTVEVSDGLFQEELAFGTGAFDGDPRYLQIIIDGTPLPERHPIRPSPMALYALYGDGEGGHRGWLLGGNLDTDPSTDFLGTADATPFEIRVDGQRALYIQPQDNPDFAPNLVAGHGANSIESDVLAGTIAGGGVGFQPHFVEANYGTVSGGRDNTVSGTAATVSGGRSNLASGSRATVSGGKDNVASANFSTVGGGEDNTGEGWFSTVAGGQDNIASGGRSTVGGGQRNTADGSRATVPGGGDNVAEGDFSFAAGRKAIAEHSGSFVWSHNDAQSVFVSTGEDQFLIRSAGGVGINTNSPQEALDVAGRLRVGNFASETSEHVCRTKEGTLAECSGAPGNGGDSIWDQVGDDAVYQQGNVGIGTDSPSVPLQVDGSGHFGFDGNEASGENSFVTGGDSASPNIAEARGSFVGGGESNEVTWNNSAVVAGRDSFINQSSGFIGGGENNQVISAGFRAAVVGGVDNTAASGAAFIGGGENNTASSPLSFIGGGENNEAGGQRSAVAGGSSNTATAWDVFIGGGTDNDASGTRSAVVGGNSNDATDFNAFIGGGWQNQANGQRSAVVGGGENEVSELHAFIGGGEQNTASEENAFVGGGRLNEASGRHSAVVGGNSSNATDLNAFIGGGFSNEAGESNSAVVGGAGNDATDANAFVGGGLLNEASGARSAVLGGNSNDATDANAFIGGGWDNEASGERSAVVGGFNNTASGTNAHIGGGSNNTAGAENTFAAGTSAQALHANSFVWSGGGAERGVESTAENQFVVAASGAVQFISDKERTMGVELAPGGSGWSVVSDRKAKTAIKPTDPVDVLNRVVELEVSEYSYKSQDESIRHMGPMAQDFHPLFGLGEDELRVSAMNLAGIALAAIQGLDAERQADAQRLAEVEAENMELRDEIAGLREQVDANSRLAEQNAELEDRLAALEALLLEDRQVVERGQ